MADTAPPAIEAAELNWRDGVPESRHFGDVYFNRDNGLEETRYVFLQQNRIPERFARLADGECFVVGETGFGTGLNFLAVWQAWRNANPPGTSRLHFVSVERYPLLPEDLRKALALWPELSDLAAELVENYPPLVSGVHRLILDGGRVRLTLYFGDVLDAWRELPFTADAWFLDGFAPARNPGMWLDETLRQIRQHSRSGTTLATFTAVGRVRRGLSANGFTMSRVEGYGPKWDMLQGVMEQPDVTTLPTATHPGVTIIGAGVAGCLLAANLAERGVQVTLVDSARGPGYAASGNLQGALYVKLGVEFNAQTQLALTALLYSQRYYQRFAGQQWFPTGLLQLACGASEADRQHRFISRNQYPETVLTPISVEQARQLTGVEVDHGGLWFPNSGWLKPSALCQTLSGHPNITRHYATAVESLSRDGEGWRIATTTGSIDARQVVISGGHQTPTLIPCDLNEGHFRFKTIRGQVSHLPDTLVHSPSAVICGPRYVNPSSDGTAVTGATFDLHDDSPDVSGASHQENLQELDAMLPGIWKQGRPENSEGLAGRVGFRCTTHDYQPVVGDLSALPGLHLDNLYLLTGLGSKGLTYAPLLAEYLADRLTNEPVCLPNSLALRVRPERCFRAVRTESSAPD